MPTSKITLPDINVWVALASDRHFHHGLARDWFATVGETGAAFCRVTQMGFLRRGRVRPLIIVLTRTHAHTKLYSIT